MLEFIISNFGYFDLIIFVSLLLLGFVINLLGVDKKKIRIGFLYNVMPSMKPIRIETKGKGFWKGIWMWLTCTREWELTRDWHFSIGNTKYIIPTSMDIPEIEKIKGRIVKILRICDFKTTSLLPL